MAISGRLMGIATRLRENYGDSYKIIENAVNVQFDISMSYSTRSPSPSVALDSPYSHLPASDRDTWICLCDKCDPCASYAPPVRVQYALGDASTTIVRPIATVHSRLSRGENFKHV